MKLYIKIVLFVGLIMQLFACDGVNKNNDSSSATDSKNDVVKEFLQLKVLFNNDNMNDIILDSLPYWNEGLTVGNVMDSVNGEINLKFKEYAGIGRLLTGIENISVTDTTFWYLCINDTASDKGMDDKTLNPGSSISWQFGIENPCYKNQFKL